MDKTTGKQVQDLIAAATELPIEDQETLVETLQNHLRELKRAELIRDVQTAQKEFAEGKCQPVTPEQLMAELLE